MMTIFYISNFESDWTSKYVLRPFTRALPSLTEITFPGQYCILPPHCCSLWIPIGYILFSSPSSHFSVVVWNQTCDHSEVYALPACSVQLVAGKTQVPVPGLSGHVKQKGLTMSFAYFSNYICDEVILYLGQSYTFASIGNGIITHKTKNGSLVKMRNVKTIKRDMPVHNVFLNF